MVISAIRRIKAFTLIELLVVIAIIGLLAGILLPALMAARNRARMAKCTNNMHTFALALETYSLHYPGRIPSPPWLSTLYPEYIETTGAFLCPADSTNGKEGGKPSWKTDTGVAWDEFDEADDTDDCHADDILSAAGISASIEILRHTDVHACSYMYEFSWAPCTWWEGGNWSDKNNWANFDKGNNGPTQDFVSWSEAKQTEMNGWYYDSAAKRILTDDAQRYSGYVPIVRCFWHGKNFQNLDSQPVLNLASGHKAVFESTASGDDWKNYAKNH